MDSLDAHEIAPGLWQGSRPPPGNFLRNHGFRALVLCAMEHQPQGAAYPGIQVFHAPMDDGWVAPGDIRYAQTRFARSAPRDASPSVLHALRAAHHVAGRVSQGIKTLVTCNEGRNRSGLVNAIALTFLTKLDGKTCMAQVQNRRRDPKGKLHPYALTNSNFQRLLQAIPRGKQ